ncbi:MAG: carboxypeptidase-like regulatory domain-containing protein, partial [Ginsengibacter sp.]
MSFLTVKASTEYNISGIVRNQVTGESIIGATVQVISAKEAVATNEYGFFSIKLPAGDYKLSVSSVGMMIKEIEVHLFSDFYQVIFLEEAGKTLNEVIVHT